MTVKMIKINSLKEIKEYEDPKTAAVENALKKWTKGVQLVLLDTEGQITTTNQWVYIDNKDELVYDKRNNRWTKGDGFYNEGKSHIQEIHVLVNG